MEVHNRLVVGYHNHTGKNGMYFYPNLCAKSAQGVLISKCSTAQC